VVPKHARRLAGFDEAVLSLYAKGMTTGDIANHLADIYGTQVSRDLVSRVTDAVVEQMQQWQSRPLDAVYPVLLIDAIVLKIRDGQVANQPVYVAMGITVDGERDVVGLWVGPAGGEGAKQWMSMLTELRNRGVADVCVVCCDGLKGLPDAITATWPLATVQTCVVHLVRNSLRYASRPAGSRRDPAALAPVRPGQSLLHRRRRHRPRRAHGPRPWSTPPARPTACSVGSRTPARASRTLTHAGGPNPDTGARAAPAYLRGG